MVHKVFVVRDTKGEMFLPPMLVRSHGEAERALKEATRNPDSLISKYPEDYDLYHLGEFNDKTGKYDLLDAPAHIVNAALLIESLKPVTQ